jgi:hypothetical protein
VPTGSAAYFVNCSAVSLFMDILKQLKMEPPRGVAPSWLAYRARASLEML